MGINSSCYIPNDTRAEDIVEAIAFLCGAKRIKMPLGYSFSTSYASSHNDKEVSVRPNEKAKHVWVASTHDMQYFIINIAPTTCDKAWHNGSLFLYPSLERPNRYCLYAGVSDFWRRIDEALIDLFGGEVDDNDSDAVEIDYRKKKPRATNCPNNGEEWQEFQDALLGVPKLFDFID